MCDHIISTVFRAESCKQLAACLFRGKIWMQYLILFKSVTFCYHLLSHNHRLNDRWWPFLHFVHGQVIVVIPLHQQVTTHRQVIDVHLFKMFCFRFSLADPVGLLQEHDIWRMIYLQPCAKRRSIRYVEKVPFSSLFCRFRSANYRKNHCRAYPLREELHSLYFDTQTSIPAACREGSVLSSSHISGHVVASCQRTIIRIVAELLP